MQNKQLSQEIKDRLSALVDDELSESESVELTQQINDQDALRKQTARYQMINCCLRGETVDCKVLSLSAVVSRALEAEPTILAPVKRSRKRRWLQPVAGTAIAASIAGLGIVFAPQLMQQKMPSQPVGLQVVAQPLSVQPALVSHKPTHWKTLNPDMEPRMNRYLEAHSEQVSQGGVQTAVPYTSYVSYDKRKR